MSKYTAKQIAESDDLFDKQIHKVRKFYLSRNPDKNDDARKKEKLLSKNEIKVFPQNMIRNIIAEPAELKTVRSHLKPDIAFTVIRITGFQKMTNS